MSVIVSLNFEVSRFTSRNKAQITHKKKKANKASTAYFLVTNSIAS